VTTIFILVRDLLIYLSRITNRSYNEINIIVYYYFIPFLYCMTIDYKFNIQIFKISFLILLIISAIIIKDFNQFSNKLFEQSVVFLKSFKFFGWDYINSSVIICVILPIILLLIILFY